jgi:glycerol-3-phosphate dehydrogenase
MAQTDTQVAIIGGGVVGSAVTHALTRRRVGAVLLESEPDLALGASGTNSGILHTGFDSIPGELETQLILRSAVLREELCDELGLAVWRCGARLLAAGAQERVALRALAANAQTNGVQVHLDSDGSLAIPGEAVTDPVAFTLALAGAAAAGGATVRTGACVTAVAAAARGPSSVELTVNGVERLTARAVANCAGLFADDIARLAGDETVAIYPRKGEFLVFGGQALEPVGEILLPMPSSAGKGVLVFPTVDGHVIAGPTARDRTDKSDWSVEDDAAELIMARATRVSPALSDAEVVGSYAGLRPAGGNRNYVIEHSRALPGLVHVAAIRSTGLSASLAIGEHVAAMLVEAADLTPDDPRPLPTPRRQAADAPWWKRASEYRRSQSPPPRWTASETP